MTHRRDRRGQAVVEFALVAPVFFALLFGVVAAGWLFFQNSAIGDAAQGGARTALVETSLDSTTNPQAPGDECESGLTKSGTVGTGTNQTIESAVQKAANIVPVNPNPLCHYASDASNVLTQTPVAGDASIKLTATGGLSSPTSFTVQVSYVAHPLAPLLGTTITLTSSSTLIAQGAANG
ncbi:MAG: TadE/TadG family type IV pilus assembly protein [Candidatus Dormibacteria bacterium]